MNICITGFNYKKVEQAGKFISKEFGYCFVDAKKEFQLTLINSAKYPTALVNGYLQEEETKLIKKLCKIPNCVFCVSADSFIANKIKPVKNSVCLLLEELMEEQTTNNLQKLIKSKCAFSSSTKQGLLNYLKNC